MFGSVAKGEADLRSDVDFLVLFDTTGDPNQLSERNEVSKIALDLEKKFNRDIQLVFSNINLDELDGQFVEEVLREGIILFGRAPIAIDKKLGFVPYVLVHFKLTGLSRSDKMKVKRALYGYRTKRRYKGRIYISHIKGLVSELGGKRTGIASILLPYRKSRPLLDTLERFGARISKITVWLPEAKHETAFDSKRFASDVNMFVKIQEKDTKEKILEIIKDQATNLPYDGMAGNIRSVVMTLLLALQDALKDKRLRRLCLNILSIISGRRDDMINSKMKELFLKRICEIYDALSIEEKRDALKLLQRLQGYDSKLINQLITEAVEKWTQREFQNLLNSIEFNRLDKGDLEHLRNRLWNWRASAKEKGEEEKVDRIDKVLELYVFR